MDLDNLSPELQEKAKACKTIEELEELANAEGLELTDELLASIAGGFCVTYCVHLTTVCTSRRK